jgi:hypothetical protein
MPQRVRSLHNTHAGTIPSCLKCTSKRDAKTDRPHATIGKQKTMQQKLAVYGNLTGEVTNRGVAGKPVGEGSAETYRPPDARAISYCSAVQRSTNSARALRSRSLTICRLCCESAGSIPITTRLRISRRTRSISRSSCSIAGMPRSYLPDLRGGTEEHITRLNFCFALSHKFHIVSPPLDSAVCDLRATGVAADSR